MCNKWLQWVDSALLGSALTLRGANKVVRRKINSCEESQFENDARLQHSREDLDSMLNISVQRLERIENKAMGTLLGVAVAITVFGATSDLLGSDGILAGSCLSLRIVVAALLIIAMLNLFASGFLALEAYKIGHVYRPTLSERAPVTEERQEKIVTLYAIEQNQKAATLRSNNLSASFTCLRNGLVVVVLLGILVVVASLGPAC